MALSDDNGSLHYQLRQSVTYQVEINFSVTQLTGAATFYFKVPRLNDRQPNSSLTQGCPPYQESTLLYNEITGNIPGETIMGHHDKFNNTYDSYNASLSIGNPTVKLSQKYLTKLNEISFDPIGDSDIGDYNYSDEIFSLYCNNSDVFYNRTDPNLIALSNNIVDPLDNVVTKAQKICNWVSNFLNYNQSLEDEIGATYAYGNQSGDCSEFSSLMITLLRIQNIPARKVTGILLSNVNNFKPKIGEVYTFSFTKTGITTLLGHAWIEYYVPDIGWIACDPLWHKETGDYFNKIDFLRFNFNVGAWFFYPPDVNTSEFSAATINGLGFGTYDYNYEFKVTVIDTAYISIDIISLIIIITIVGIICIAIILIVRSSKKKRKEKDNYY